MKNRKWIGTFLVLMISFFVFPLVSKAETGSNCLKVGSCTKLCEWQNNNATITAYYFIGDESVKYGWKFEGDKNEHILESADSKYVEFQDDGIRSAMENGSCAKGAYASTNNFWNGYICFDSGNGECQSKSGNVWKQYGGENSVTYDFNSLITTAFSSIDPNYDCNSVVDSTGYAVDENKLQTITNGFYSKASQNLGGIDLTTLEYNSAYTTERNKFNNRVILHTNQCRTQFDMARHDAVAKGDLSEEESKKIEDDNVGLESKVDQALSNSEQNPGSGNSDLPGEPSTGGEASCTGILGNGETLKYVKIALTVIQIGGVLLAIILSMIDFMGAVMSGDADINKKVTKKLTIRIAMAAILLLVPALLKFVLDTFGIAQNGDTFCIL